MARIGFVFVRQIGAPRFEPFFNQVIAGLEDVLAPHGATLTVKSVDSPADEIEVYRHWHTTAAVDAVVVKDLTENDQRIEQLNSFGMPFVALCDTTQTGPFSAVRFDNGQAMRTLLAQLISQHHTRIARVTGPPTFVHTRIRTAVFSAVAEQAGIEYQIVEGDYSQPSGQHATRALLSGPPAHPTPHQRPAAPPPAARPTAIIYDNDLMALGGLTAAQELSLDVPKDLYLVAWDDSVLCQLAQPPLSALNRDVHAIGAQLGTALLHVLAGGAVVADEAAQPVLVSRGAAMPAPPATPEPARAAGQPPPQPTTLTLERS